MKHVEGTKVRESLAHQIRVYLCGKLDAPEPFNPIQTEGLEIGISHYQEFTVEKPHLHTWNHEYNFVKSGSVKVYVFDEHQEYEFQQDDMYMIEPNMPYITKAQPGTEVIFVKSPGGNDKELVPVTDSMKKWGETWESIMEE